MFLKVALNIVFLKKLQMYLIWKTIENATVDCALMVDIKPWPPSQQV